MKKVLLFGTILAMILVLIPITALAADPPYDGYVAGILAIDTSTIPPTFTIHLEGDYDLTIVGSPTGPDVGNYTYFAGTSTGDIEGTLTGTINAGGLDTMYAVFDTINGSVPAVPVRIVGTFVQSGIDGDFEGEIITGALPSPVTSLTLGAEGGVTEVIAGRTLQMTAVTDPVGSYDINWSIYVNDRDKAMIDQNGLVTGMQPGSVIVIANTQDPNVATDTFTLTVVNPKTEVTGSVDPTYMVIIPAAIDFGTLVKDTGVQTQIFPVQASSMVIEDGFEIEVGLLSNFTMKDKDGEGSVELEFSLFNATTSIATGEIFASFDTNRTENGTMEVDTSAITAAGNYKGTIDFTISYVAE